MTRLADYRTELAEVKRGLTATCRELLAELATRDRPVEAARIDEAQAFLRASLHSIDQALAALQRKGLQ